MKKHALKIVTLLLITAAIFQACHTYVFDNVKEKIQGQWTMMPVEPGNNTQFLITNDSIKIFQNGNPVPMVNTEEQTVFGAGYTVQNGVTNHHLIIDPFQIKNFGIKSSMFVRTEKWLVVTLTKEELYLESLGKDGLKGEYQLHFYKKQ